VLEPIAKMVLDMNGKVVSLYLPSNTRKVLDKIETSDNEAPSQTIFPEP
jgi:hypothetical protein